MAGIYLLFVFVLVSFGCCLSIICMSLIRFSGSCLFSVCVCNFIYYLVFVICMLLYKRSEVILYFCNRTFLYLLFLQQHAVIFVICYAKTKAIQCFW